MAVYNFRIGRLHTDNLVGVQGSLVNINKCKLYRTARGAYLLRVASILSEPLSQPQPDQPKVLSFARIGEPTSTAYRYPNRNSNLPQPSPN